MIDANGWDGGHLTVQIDSCKFAEYVHYAKRQDSQPGFIANLVPNDIFIEWDENPGDELRMLFEFTGECVPETPPYIQVFGDPYTTWTVYRVLTPGTLSKTTSGYNEHDALHLRERLFDLVKDDGLNDPNDCIAPGQELTYTICWTNTRDATFEDCCIIDWLPPEVEYTSQETDPNYNPDEHFYRWDLGAIGPHQEGCVTLPVTVTPKAAPGTQLHNLAQLYSDETLVASATEITPVCCWDLTDPNVIFVDADACGNDNGTCWKDAYTNLQDALTRARENKCFDTVSIYIAEGRYNPGPYESSSFILPDNISIYGGFPAGGSDPNDRNPLIHQTILTGKTSPGDQNVTLVTMGQNTLLDGCSVTKAASENIYGMDVDFTVRNCTITNSTGYGIYARNGDINATWCNIQKNGYTGIHHEGQGSLLTVDNCRILTNNGYGIYTRESTPAILNSIIANNGLTGGSTPDGVRIFQPYTTPALYNSTIAYNNHHGISFSDNYDISGDPNFLDWPDVQNCIVWYNNNNDRQLEGFEPDIAAYSFIQDCNEVNHNYNSEPRFAYPADANNLHLAWNSPCKDKGNPSLMYDGQYDIDGESRQVGEAVDIGADEIYTCDGDLTEDDIYRPLDWNLDGSIDFQEFAAFSQAWLSHQPEGLNPTGEPSPWNPIWNLNKSGPSADYIDLADLAELIDNGWWLWEACWRQSQRNRMSTLPPP